MVSTLAILTTIALVAAAPVCRSAPRTARAEILPIDDLERAKMDKEEVKRKREEHNIEDSSNSGEDSQCGSVAIGNNDSANQSGSDRIAPRSTTVIVTGNVYNTASCGR